MKFPSNKRSAWIVILIGLIAQHTYGQSTEVSIQAGSGWFSFGGASAVSTSFVNISDIATISGYTNNPYGRQSGFSYGLGTQLQRITKSNLILGLQLGYESLSSKVTIDDAAGEITWTVTEGKTILTNQFMNINPFIGQRFEWIKSIKTDFKLGLDFGVCLSSKEKFEITTSQGGTFTGTRDRNNPNVDFRSRIEMVNYYKRIGFSIGYSLGHTNYTVGMVGANFECKSKYFRLGLSYLLN